MSEHLQEAGKQKMLQGSPLQKALARVKYSNLISSQSNLKSIAAQRLHLYSSVTEKMPLPPSFLPKIYSSQPGSNLCILSSRTD